MRFCVLASGSAGNATFISTATTRILIDDGLSVKKLVALLAEIGEKPENLDGILVSHEHGDHVSGIPRLLRHCIKRGKAIPTWVTGEAVKGIDWEGLEQPPVQLFQPGASWSIGDIGISSFTIPHDSAEAQAFRFEADGVKVGLATDLGFIPDALRARFRDLDLLMIESNYDAEMLKVGPYPANVKMRVGGRYGHLSNDAVAEYMGSGDFGKGLRHVILGHLSEANNMPEMVQMNACEALSMRESEAELILAEQNRRTKVIEL